MGAIEREFSPLSLLSVYHVREKNEMPRKKKEAASEAQDTAPKGRYWSPNDAVWGGFINLKLDDEQKQTFYAWFENPPVAVVHLLEDLLGAGAKVGMAYDEQNQCHVASVTGALVSNSNERYCVTSRAGTFTECLALAVWKHFYLTDGDFGNFVPRTGRMNNWG